MDYSHHIMSIEKKYWRFRVSPIYGMVVQLTMDNDEIILALGSSDELDTKKQFYSFLVSCQKLYELYLIYKY